MPALTRKPKNSKKSVLDQIAKLQEAVAEERRKLRELELELERQAAGEEVRQARERYIQALQRNKTGAEEHEELRKAEERTLGDLDLRIDAQGRRIRDAEGEVQRFVGEHFSEVGQEKLSKDRAARDKVVELADELVGAIDNVKQEAQHSDELVRLGGLPPRIDGSPVSLNLEGLERALRDVQESGVRLPSARAWSPEGSTGTTLEETPNATPAGFVA